MDFGFTKQEEAIKAEVHQFIKNHPLQQYTVEYEDDAFGFGGWSTDFARAVGEHGWFPRTWPKKFGGEGRPLLEKVIFVEEMAYYRAPMASTFLPGAMAHAIMEHTTPEVREEILPKMAKGTFRGWLGFSEPQGGSDLGGIQTRAVNDGDYYIINGQKLWSAYAHNADYCFLLTKTDVNALPRNSLTLFILDKKLPGIEIEGLTTMARTHMHNVIYLNEVRVHKNYILGELNGGFKQLLSGLDSERFWGRVVKAPWAQRLLEDLIVYAKNTKRDGRYLSEDPVIRDKFARCAVEIEACRLMHYEIGWKMQEGIPYGPAVTASKLYADEMGQRFLTFAIELLGPENQQDLREEWQPLKNMVGMVARLHLLAYGHTLAAGSVEILRNDLAHRKLGLPSVK